MVCALTAGGQTALSLPACTCLTRSDCHMHMPLAGAAFSFDLCTHMVPNTVVTDFGNREGQCQGGKLLYLVKLLYVILHFRYGILEEETNLQSL